MPKKDVFDRAEQALQDGTAADCAAAIEALKTLEAEERPIAEASRPPGERVPTPNGGTFGLPTGERYARAAAADDRKAVAECEQDYHRIQSRLEQARVLADQLEQRRKQQAEQEAYAAAPGTAQTLIEQIDDLADAHMAAREALVQAHGRLRAAVDELVRCRQTNPESPTLSLEQLHRTGTELAYSLPKRVVVEETYGGSRPVMDIQPLFGDEQKALRVARTLIDPPQSLTNRIKQMLGQRTMSGSASDQNYKPDTSDRAVNDRVNAWLKETVRLLGEDNLAAARKLPPPTYKRGNPVFTTEVA